MLHLIFLFILGTIIGSFLNVCIHRLPRGESIIYPASHCPQCNRRLGTIDLIPIFGYFLLGGKCRYCRANIPFRYPLVELISGLLLVGVALKFPPTKFPLEFIFYILFSFLCIIVFFTDLEEQVIPDSVSVTGIFAGLIFNYLKGIFFSRGEAMNPFLSALFGMLLGYVLLYLIAKAGRMWFKKEVMGEGDLYLVAFLGAYLGWQGALLSIFLAYLLAGVVTLPLLLFGKVKMKSYVPFGPALVAGGILSLFFGQQLINWYLGLFL
jgi:leader peptidase (prepilin peptidase)/N-methyltransferase